jgi:hypothetical protein
LLVADITNVGGKANWFFDDLFHLLVLTVAAGTVGANQM